jgi:hypothetical protein
MTAGSDREVADGVVQKTDNWADAVVFDDSRVGSGEGTAELAAELRAEGHAVVGGTPNTDRLEDNRGYAMEVPEDHGVSLLTGSSPEVQYRTLSSRWPRCVAVGSRLQWHSKLRGVPRPGQRSPILRTWGFAYSFVLACLVYT